MVIRKNQILGILTEAFPDFVPDNNYTDLPYVLLGDFSHYLRTLHESEDEQQLQKAVQLIERLHVEGDNYVKEAATIGLLEGIQNTWEHAGLNPEMFGRRLLPESKRWWDSLNKFWKGEVPHVGADLNDSDSN